jgi:signal transduction histidine kinase
VPRFFATIPFAWSLIGTVSILIPTDLTFRTQTVENPSSFKWFVLMHICVVAIIGATIRAIVGQLRQRQLLAEQLAGAERRAGQLEERQRVARDIHDSLAQGFAGIVAHLETAELERERNPVNAAKHAEFALTVARQSLEDARRMMTAMLPEPLDDQDLAGAVTRVAREWSQRTGIACDTITTGDVRGLDRDIEVALLRVTQEALTNVWKHAGAKRVTVTLSYLDDVVALDVHDDGCGLDAEPAESATRGFGLNGMRARVEALGGSLAVESVRGEGTTISASVTALPSDTASWVATGPAPQ